MPHKLPLFLFYRVIQLFNHLIKIMENKYIAYYRVSTKRQEISGLGLSAQRQIVLDYLKHQNVTIYKSFVEQESGKVNDRPELLKAIEVAKDNGILIVAKLDRLSRSVQFISTLMESKVKFICCDIPDCNELTLHIFSAMAEFERKRISERICNALQAKRQKDPTWIAGTNNLTDAGREKAYNTITSNARNNTSIRHALHYITMLMGEGLTYQQIATQLNTEGYKTRTGKYFHAQQVWNIWKRMGGNQNDVA